MTAAPVPDDEYARLLALAGYEILDTPPEDAFDRATRLAAHLLRTPVAFINFVDQHRQWSKAAVGVTDTTAPRSDSLCAWTILQDTPLVIEDTHQDPRFMDNPFVTGDPHIHMYAGAPLITPTGHRIGTLCVTDTQPHALTPADLTALQDLAAMVVAELELRRVTLQLQDDLGAQTQLSGELRRTLAQAQVLEGVSELMELDLSPEELTLAAAALLSAAVSSDSTSLLVFEEDGLRVAAAASHSRLSPAQRLLFSQLPEWTKSVTHTLRETTLPLYLDNYPQHPKAVPEVVAAGVRQIAWVPLGSRGGVTSLLMAVRFEDHSVGAWRRGDRALLEAAGRTMRSALDRRVLTETARQEARQDARTGALNRRALNEDLLVRESGTPPFLLAMLDLDGLKGVNDREGHVQGDKVLRVFAGTLGVELDSGAHLYRVGGDEFIALMDSREVEVFYEAVEVAVLAARQVAPFGGVSVGVAYSPEAQGAALMALADTRMYEVKQRRQALRQG
ncbi:GAF domain-containing protein [Deinococcus sp. QL22]|uniref:sensor domain-containing diguanylate cyclase n=1 Tax=Deinococcus sp. QL22 TaxID=2939437 RepID=UPI0020170414|nr:GAF domain-containing protein [Deinococcus sp. QL22]UQN08294.1 diguanylate cyclase [Deinococcus sp. QL22]